MILSNSAPLPQLGVFFFVWLLFTWALWPMLFLSLNMIVMDKDVTFAYLLHLFTTLMPKHSCLFHKVSARVSSSPIQPGLIHIEEVPSTRKPYGWDQKATSFGGRVYTARGLFSQRAVPHSRVSEELVEEYVPMAEQTDDGVEEEEDL